MKPNNLSRCIRLTFAHNAEPGSPLPLDKESTDKLGQIPKLVRALVSCYGSRLSGPTLWGGDVHLSICSDAELFDVSDTMIADLTTTARELHENSQRQPPLPLTQAVTNPHCLDLLRALAQTYDKSQLTASLDIAGRSIELPHIDLADFTEPEMGNDGARHLWATAIGVCIPTQDANVVLLADMTLLELPTAAYPLSTDECYARVQTRAAAYVGPAELVRKGVYRALPGGNLQAQLQI